MQYLTLTGNGILPDLKLGGVSSKLVILKREIFVFESDCCLTPTQHFFQLYHGENKLIFNEMMKRSAF
jgi:hypothetical protein